VPGIIQALGAALRLFKFDASGIDRFDQSIEGFWRSFAVIVLGVPFMLLANVTAPAPAEPGGAGPLAEVATYLLVWLFMPVAAVFLTRAFGLSARYVPYVIALNWMSLIAHAIAALVGTVARADSPLALIFVPLLLYLFTVEWFTTRVALRTTGWLAATFVAVDVVSSIAIGALFGVFD